MIIILGSGIVLIAFCFLIYHISIVSNAVEVKALVYDKYIFHHPDGDEVYIKVKFTTHNGELIQAEEPYLGSYGQLNVGDSVQVIYNKENPNRIILNKGYSFMFDIIFVFIGVFITLSGFYLYKHPSLWNYFKPLD